jgi:ankyrin repeat protein
MTEFIEVLELLLQSGSDINERDGEGRTILFAWPEFRDFRSERAVDYVSILLQHGADASVIDKTGATPLHLFDRGWGKAVNNENVLKILVKAGADINAATIDGQTPLIASAKRQLMYPSSFDGLNVDFDRQDLEGNTALHYACNSACMEYEHAKEWLARCDPKIRNNAGRFAFTNFHWLNGGQGRVDAIALMVEKGLSLESRDYLGRTPLLHFLSSSGRGSVHFVEELLRLGADARAVDYQGKSSKFTTSSCLIVYFSAAPTCSLQS